MMFMKTKGQKMSQRRYPVMLMKNKLVMARTP